MNINSFENLDIESMEKPKFHCTFSDGSILGCPVIFECDASDDLDADKKFSLYVQEAGISLADSEIRRSSVKI